METKRIFFQKVPKVELHIHLEGAIPLDALWLLIEKYGEAQAVGSRSALVDRFRFRDFSHFISTWAWKNTFLREYEDFVFIAREFSRDLVKQNIDYAEVSFTPVEFEHRGLTIQKITEAVRSGIAEFSDRLDVRLILDFCRDLGPEKALWQLEQSKELKGMGVIGIGMGGAEQLYPPEPFEKVYSLARDYGYRTTVHAGEAMGAQSIWAALRILKAGRIGHGTRACEDEGLVNYLAHERIPVEMCPLSNVRTACVQSIAEHPVKDFLQKGLLVFVNTDDPKMFNNSMEEEFIALTDGLDMTLSQIKQLQLNAIDAAWCADEKKHSLRRELEQFYAIHSAGLNDSRA